VIDGDAHQLRAGARELGDLLDRGLDVRGVRVGHGLDDDRRLPPTVTGPMRTGTVRRL
jgi:hypothetical protein